MENVSGLQAGVGQDQVGGAADDQDTGGNAQIVDSAAQVVSQIDGEDAQTRHQALLRVRGIEQLIHLVVVFDGGNEKSFLFVAASDLHLQHLIEAVQIERRG